MILSPESFCVVLISGDQIPDKRKASGALRLVHTNVQFMRQNQRAANKAVKNKGR